MRVASLHIHPVKGMRAIDLDSAHVEAKGLASDRRWMVVDKAGKFVTQRTHPALATISATFEGDALVLSAAGAETLHIDTPSGAKRRRVTVWEAHVDAALAGSEAGRWLSQLIEVDVDLVYMDEKAARLKESVWTADALPVSFADGFPVLVTTTASLAALNDDIAAHGDSPVPIARFRPNIVIDCDEAWAEDRWRQLKIGDVVLDLVKPCDRCIVTTTDQQTGERKGPEPIAALSRLRRSKDPRIKGVLFGVNAVPRAFGEISVGDEVSIAP